MAPSDLQYRAARAAILLVFAIEILRPSSARAFTRVDGLLVSALVSPQDPPAVFSAEYRAWLGWFTGSVGVVWSSHERSMGGGGIITVGVVPGGGWRLGENSHIAPNLSIGTLTANLKQRSDETGWDAFVLDAGILYKTGPLLVRAALQPGLGKGGPGFFATFSVGIGFGGLSD